MASVERSRERRQEVSQEQNAKEGPPQLGSTVDLEGVVRIYIKTKSLKERLGQKDGIMTAKGDAGLELWSKGEQDSQTELSSSGCGQRIGTLGPTRSGDGDWGHSSVQK